MVCYPDPTPVSCEVPPCSKLDDVDLRILPEKLGEPIRWSTPRRIFVNSMSDLFHLGVEDALRERARRANREDFLSFLEASPDIPSLTGDELPGGNR